MNPFSVLALPLLFGLAAATATAQCVAPGGGTKVAAWVNQTYNYTGISANHVPLGFAFPMPGAARPSFTHVRIGAKGWVLLTDGVSSTGLPGVNVLGSPANTSDGLAGLPGDFPLITPWWSNLQWYTLAADGVFVDTVPGVSCKVSWVNVRDVGSSTNYSFAVELFATGEVRFHYGSTVDNRTPFGNANYAAVSRRNGLPLVAADFLPGPVTTPAPGVYQAFAPYQFDMADKTLVWTPWNGGWTTSFCGGASHSSSGTGCGNAPATGVYQLFADAAAASTALQGNALQFTRVSTGYTAQWLPGGAAAWLPPSAATGPVTPITAGDDGDVLLNLPSPLPVPGGTLGAVRVSANGIVTLANSANHSNDWTPTGAEFAAAPGAAFYAWHDFNPVEAGSGQILAYPVGNRMCITWNDVESYASPEVANRSTMQFVFDLGNGDVLILWPHVDGNASSIYGSAHLVGMKGIGSVVDGGSIDFTVPGARATYTGQAALQLTAAPLPVYGTTFTYTTANVPEYWSGSGLFLVGQMISLGHGPGVDLGYLGAPGCLQYVGQAVVTVLGFGGGPTVTVPLPLPASGPLGLPIYAQSVALGAAGQFVNAGGVLTSNLVTSVLNPF